LEKILQDLRISTPDRIFIEEKNHSHCLLKVMWSGRSYWLFASGLFFVVLEGVTQRAGELSGGVLSVTFLHSSVW
jgi:hypothetical protein